MSQLSHRGFSQLFASVWNTFKSNYLLCLGIMVPFVLMMPVAVVGRVATGVWATGDDLNVLAGQTASIAFWFFFASLIMSPIIAYLFYKIVRRVRHGSRSNKGLYGKIVALMMLGNVCLLPGVAAMAVGNPNQFVGMELGWELIQDSITLSRDDHEARAAKASGDQQDQKGALAENEKEVMKEVQSKEKKMKELKSTKRAAPSIVGFLLIFVGVLSLWLWLPWSAMALLDPEENASDVKSAIRRGREIASGSFWPIIGVWFIITIIAGVSCAALLLPGIFFGIPLAICLVPGMYLCLRGELQPADA